MQRREHAVDDRLVDTITFKSEDIQQLIKNNELHLASGQATANDMYCLGTVPGEFIEAWCFANGVKWPDFMVDTRIQTDFINSDFAKPFRVWRGKF